MVDSEMHVDEEQYLLEKGSNQTNLWGVNLYPSKFGTDNFVEFDALINIRPRQHNLSRMVENPELRARIVAFINQKVLP